MVNVDDSDLITKISWWGLMIMMIWKRRKRKSDHCVGDQPAGLGVFQRLKLQLFYFSNIPMVSPFIVMIDFAIPGTVTMITMTMMMIMMMMITMMLFASCRLLGDTKHGLESDKTSEKMMTNIRMLFVIITRHAGDDQNQCLASSMFASPVAVVRQNLLQFYICLFYVIALNFHYKPHTHHRAMMTPPWQSSSPPHDMSCAENLQFVTKEQRNLSPKDRPDHWHNILMVKEG